MAVRLENIALRQTLVRFTAKAHNGSMKRPAMATILRSALACRQQLSVADPGKRAQLR
jgi:hypothetical protein